MNIRNKFLQAAVDKLSEKTKEALTPGEWNQVESVKKALVSGKEIKSKVYNTFMDLYERKK